jgi:hypothetical protein
MRTRFVRTRSLVAVVAGAALCFGLLGTPAFAQGKKKPEAAKPAQKADAAKTADGQAGGGDAKDDQTKVKVERGAGGKKVYKIEGEIVIEGKIQKPEAFYVLQKSSINYDWHELKQEFVPKILESVTKAPF